MELKMQIPNFQQSKSILMLLFFLKILKIDLNKGLQSFSWSRDPITTCKLLQTKTPHNFWWKYNDSNLSK